MKTVRSYSKIVNELINLNLPYRIEIIGYVNYDKIYPLLALKHISKTANKTIVITSGQHGDEPFAVITLLKWLKQPIIFTEFNYFIFPVINPWGYEKNKRDNGNKQDTNNDVNFVKDSKVPELAFLYDSFPVNVDLILDIHGDTRKENVYLYEHKAENLPSIAEKALIENDILLPYLKQKTIDKIQVINGVINPPPQDIGIEKVMENLGVEYTLTLELPGKYDGQKRAEGGIMIINSIIKNFKEIK